jgi:putative phosphoesterase
MRLGLISDIHADVKGLQHALKLLHEKQVNKILCAGDSVEKGPDGDLVVEILKAEQVECIAGNHDRDAINNQEWLRKNGDPSKPPALKTRLLSDDTLVWLNALSPNLTLTYEGIRLLIAHGAPWGDANYVFPTTRRSVFERIAQTPVKIVVLGHTHIPMLAQIDGVTICNPGSICGKLSSGSHSCVVLDLPGCQFTFYDIYTGESIAPTFVQLNKPT